MPIGSNIVIVITCMAFFSLCSMENLTIEPMNKEFVLGTSSEQWILCPSLVYYIPTTSTGPTVKKFSFPYFYKYGTVLLYTYYLYRFNKERAFIVWEADKDERRYLEVTPGISFGRCYEKNGIRFAKGDNLQFLCNLIPNYKEAAQG